MKVLVFLILSLLFSFPFSFSLVAQAIRPPSEVLDFSRIQRLYEHWENQVFEPQEILQNLQKEIQTYYQQFQKERYLRESEISIPYDFYRFPLDKIHLLLFVRKLEELQKTKRLFSPYLYFAFEFQGKLYESLNRPTNAVSSYLQALQYAIPILDITKKKEALPDTIEIHNLELFIKNPKFLEEVSTFEYWKKTFGDDNYQKELSDQNLRDNINNFLVLYQNFQKNLQEIQEIKKLYYQAQIRRDRNLQNENLRQFQQKWQELKNQWDNLIAYQETFLEEQTKLRKEYANLVYRIATLTKRIEEAHKERERVLNQSSFYRGTGNVLGVNKTLYSQFIGYIHLLELANKLDPENIEYIHLLSQEYFREKDSLKGITIEKKWFQHAPKNDPRNLIHYQRLVSYYQAVQNISLAKSQLQEWKKHLEQFPDQRNLIFEENQDNSVLNAYQRFLLFYIKFFLDHYSAEELDREINAEQTLNEMKNSITQKQQEMTEEQKNQNFRNLVEIQILLARYYQAKKNPDKEKETLLNLKSLDETLEALEEEYLRQEKEKKMEALSLKNSLYFEEDLEKTKRYYEIQRIHLPNIQLRLQSIRTLRNEFPIGKILEKIAYLNYVNKQYEEAIEIYSEIMKHKYASDDTKKRAEVNKKLIMALLRTGFQKPLLTPLDIESD
ncbi:MAG: hypothetical protein NZ853_08575 [Leptospiraceae bacterium]|nr:hypothetical protein [Leptospiraceae bacterium]MDW7976770.1 hypothetical protein [Leptospiraceae bacterium]